MWTRAVGSGACSRAPRATLRSLEQHATTARIGGARIRGLPCVLATLEACGSAVSSSFSVSVLRHMRGLPTLQVRYLTPVVKRQRPYPMYPADLPYDGGVPEELQMRTGATRVLIFDTEGEPTMHRMTRTDVLNLTKDAAVVDFAEAATPKRPPQRHQGHTGPASATHETIVDVQRVHARDIRQLDSAFALPSEPSVEVRDQAILINADPVRAIIMRNRCLVFLKPEDEALTPVLKELFDLAAYSDPDVAYEFRALEALLGALCHHYHDEFDKFAPAISSSLKRLASGPPSAIELNTLRSFKNTMNEFQSRIDGTRRALMAVLNNEEDMRLLYLTKLHSDRSLLSNLWSFDSEEAEVLIENYLQDIYATQTRATLLQQRIQNTETVVKLRLDAMRNYLLGVNIMFSVAGISLSVGTFTVGVFGMNLVSGVEQASGWFVGVTAMATALMATTGAVAMFAFKRRGVFGAGQDLLGEIVSASTKGSQLQKKPTS